MAEVDYHTYRKYMEDSVSNHNGSSAGDVLFTILPSICSILLTLTFITLFGKQLSFQARIVVEFCVTIVPCVLCCTVLHDKAMAISQIFLILSAANIISILAKKPKYSYNAANSIPTSNESKSGKSDKISFITNFRALVMVMTSICILAVDFSCFPTEFMKTETYGYSLMDAGVGLFIVANALTSPEARNIQYSLSQGVPKYLKDCVPLLGLGAARFFAVEFLGYQKHVSEYGVHWNFFLTLACVRLFTGILAHNLIYKYSLLTGLWILGMHEYALSTQGLKEWVMSDEPRDNFLSANREGWVSIPGYVGLYLIGIALGRMIHTSFQYSENQLIFNIKFRGYDFHIGYTKSMSLSLKLYIVANFAFIATYYCEKYFQVSRRLANSGYCAWVLTLSTLILTFLLMIEVLLECISGCVKDKAKKRVIKQLKRDDLNVKEDCHTIKTLAIFEAVNYNGLLFFLFVNLMTGMINLSIKTRYVTDPQAVSIILTYMVVNITFVMLRYKTKKVLTDRPDLPKKIVE
ncbi:uncharacterized protein At4g17910 [Trichogramma pretiosum]|uniref:uncharacterized protein At4g17910 n=1 Tax=Trichogramma pretiosum TaxID=7493 RepID=UPI0006C954C4|nr:uncharacterized protein At4g17910 [Trichogramma pretiosum]